MRKQIEICTCDICHKECDVLEVTYPVMVRIEQTEDCPTKPYISYEKIDMCIECVEKTLKITGSGIQGHNQYEIINDNEVKL